MKEVSHYSPTLISYLKIKIKSLNIQNILGCFLYENLYISLYVWWDSRRAPTTGLLRTSLPAVFVARQQMTLSLYWYSTFSGSFSLRRRRTVGNSVAGFGDRTIFIFSLWCLFCENNYLQKNKWTLKIHDRIVPSASGTPSSSCCIPWEWRASCWPSTPLCRTCRRRACTRSPSPTSTTSPSTTTPSSSSSWSPTFPVSRRADVVCPQGAV